MDKQLEKDVLDALGVDELPNNFVNNVKDESFYIQKDINDAINHQYVRNVKINKNKFCDIFEFIEEISLDFFHYDGKYHAFTEEQQNKLYQSIGKQLLEAIAESRRN